MRFKLLVLLAMLFAAACTPAKKEQPAPQPVCCGPGPATTATIDLGETDLVVSRPRTDDSPPDNKVFAEHTNNNSKIVKTFKFSTDKKVKLFDWQEHKSFKCSSNLDIQAKLTVKGTGLEKEIGVSESFDIDPGSYSLTVEIADSRNCDSIDYGFGVSFEQPEAQSTVPDNDTNPSTDSKPQPPGTGNGGSSSASPGKTIVNGPTLTYLRSRGPGKNCDWKVFSGTFESLFTTQTVGSVKFEKNDDMVIFDDSSAYTTWDVNIFYPNLMMKITEMVISGEKTTLEKMKSALNSGQETEFKITDSPSCAEADPKAVYLDFISSEEAENNNIDLNSRIEVIGPNKDLPCSTKLRKSIGQIISEKYPDENLDEMKVVIRGDIFQRLPKTAKPFGDSLYFSIVPKTQGHGKFSAPKQFLEIQLSNGDKNNLLEKISGGSEITTLVSEKCAEAPQGSLKISDFSLQ
jgi:hypothetical protein